MDKREIGPGTYLYPMPAVIVGVNVGGRPNYMTIAYCGIVQHSPPMISLAVNRLHYSINGLKENGAFSVNVPSKGMAEAVDYCGLVSGRKVDKSKLFENFYGKLKTAPMIAQCPLNLECKVVKNVDFGGTNEIYIGEIVQAYTDDRYMTGKLPDIKKIDPLIFSMHDNNYWALGDHVGKAWNIGKKFGEKK